MNHIYDQYQFGENWFTYPLLYKSMVDLFPSGSHFVEVGSWKGKSTAYLIVEIINSGKNIKFECVDTWEGSVEHGNIDSNSLYNTFLQNMMPLKDYFTHHRMKSVDASKMYKDESLDFVFIDACHEYDCVRDDISSWLPKVKKGGVIAGHDYYSGKEFPGVNKAVDEHFSSNTIELHQGGCWLHRVI